MATYDQHMPPLPPKDPDDRFGDRALPPLAPVATGLRPPEGGEYHPVARNEIVVTIRSEGYGNLPPSPSTPLSPADGSGRGKKTNPLVDLIETEKIYVDQLTGIIRVCPVVIIISGAKLSSIIESRVGMVKEQPATARVRWYVSRDREYFQDQSRTACRA
jgi:hypothetical protein